MLTKAVNQMNTGTHVDDDTKDPVQVSERRWFDRCAGQRNVKKKDMNALLENGCKSRKRLNASAGIVMKLLMRIRGKMTDAKTRIHQPDLRQCRTAQAM